MTMTVVASKPRAKKAAVKKPLPKKAAAKKETPKPRAEVPEPEPVERVKLLDERKREANRKHKLKSDAAQMGLSMEDFVKDRYGVTVEEFITDAYTNTHKGIESLGQPSVLELMDSVLISETDMQKVTIDQNKLKPWVSGTAFDRLLSREGGLKPGTVNIITGEPCAGKTTICSAFTIHAKRKNKKLTAGIINGEMSLLDWEEECEKNPALREVPVIFARDLGKYKGNQYLAAMRTALQRYMVCTVDSLAVLADRIKDATGMTSKDAMFWLLDVMNELAESEFRSYFVIQHFSKGKEYMGPTKIKHDTTAMAYVLFDHLKRPYIVFNKNRRNGGLLYVPLHTVMPSDGLLTFDEVRLNEYLNDVKIQQDRDAAARENKDNLTQILSIEEDFVQKINQLSGGEEEI
jgi:hypothetical protein